MRKAIIPLVATAAAQLLVIGSIAAAFAFQPKETQLPIAMIPVQADIERGECIRRDPAPYEPITYRVPLDADLQQYTAEMCDLYEVPLELAYAVMQVESGYTVSATSSTGDYGLMDYKADEVEPQFDGNERYVWPAIKNRLDAEIAAYERKAATSRENGAKGGRPPKPKETQENPLGYKSAEESEGVDEQRETSTGPPDGKPESYWIWAGCDKVLTPYMASEFRDLREAGIEDALVVAALKEAMRHQAKYPWVYAKRLLDQAAAQKITTLEAWEKVHITYKGNRVDRETPSGNSFLGLDNSLDRLKRRPLRKRAEEVPPD